MNSGTGKDSFNISGRRQMLFGLVTLAVLLGGFGLWAATTNISGAIVASGQLEVQQNQQVVQHIDGGIVAELLVKEGDLVSQDDLLLQLDDTQLRSRLTIIEGQLFELMARRGRLEAEQEGLSVASFDPLLQEASERNPDIAARMAGQSRLLAARLASMEQEIAQLGERKEQITSQITGIIAQETALGRQLDLIIQELEDQQSLLDRGLTQASRVLALQREQARLQGQLGDLEARRASAAGQIVEIDLQITRIKSRRVEDATTQLRDLQFREFELIEERASLLEQLDRLDIRAPVAGTVHNMQVFASSTVIRPAEPILYIIPRDRPLVVNARIAPIHIDEVFPGQEAVMHFTTFSQRTTPQLEGHVTRVSGDSFIDERTGASYFRAELQLDEGQLDKLPEGAVLLPGMPVDSFIRTTDRTPLEYLVKPMMDYFSRAFRES
ncbi:HlyD family type I secretion periplasmic adaptor subunit [Roseibaca sp. Y0-43]|uniref:HlyD family type I secretion periplasmic adaptor subunit n=1 Tax=Roseibaca sp. Y0-43 TaxID=2816854 RepID=UPI001D0CB780|nr:HlyD family type I secretion periplasmic adaptor subunit [Roseibaca sp. Y0-43]MCC1482852.1 HlyD family type I secretion periplasmic adaptor subunit [Roseibaca sp. Y0-43]